MADTTIPTKEITAAKLIPGMELWNTGIATWYVVADVKPADRFGKVAVILATFGYRLRMAADKLVTVKA